MEQLNKIEIRGNVGSVKVQAVGERRVMKLTVATDYVYKGRDGEPVIETTWHSVTAWEGKNMPDFDKFAKGAKVHVTGRLRSQRYIGNDGVERTAYEIQAHKVALIENEESLQYELYQAAK